MKMLMHAGVSLGPLLIALGIGYLVCAQASKEVKGLKTLGRLIGMAIIAISALLIASKVILFYGYSKMCPLKGMMMEKGMVEQQTMPIQKK